MNQVCETGQTTYDPVPARASPMLMTTCVASWVHPYGALDIYGCRGPATSLSQLPDSKFQYESGNVDDSTQGLCRFFTSLARSGATIDKNQRACKRDSEDK
jgi:hypothetical protein